MSYIVPKYSCIMIWVPINNEDPRKRLRCAMFEYQTEKPILNPKSDDGLFEDSCDCERYWVKLHGRSR
jgi:hypothetical protein